MYRQWDLFGAASLAVVGGEGDRGRRYERWEDIVQVYRRFIMVKAHGAQLEDRVGRVRVIVIVIVIVNVHLTPIIPSGRKSMVIE